MTLRAQQHAAWRSRFRHDAAPATLGVPNPVSPPPSPRVAPRPAVAVRIREFELRGFDPHLAPRIAASMRQELQRLIGGGLPPGWHTPGTVEALGGRVRLRSMRDAAGIGEALARAVLSAQAEDRA